MTSTQRGVLIGVVLAVVVAAVVLLVAASSGDDDEPVAASTTTTTTSTTSTTAPPATTTTAAPACPAGGPTARGDVAPAAADLDGDGAADTVYMLDQGDDGAPAIGVVLANGHASETAYETNIAAQAYGPTDIDGNGRQELFIVARGNTASITLVQIAVLDGCELVLARNAQGEPYVFLVADHPLEDGSGLDMAGVGCTDVDGDGTLELVGLGGVEEDGGRVRWTRTVVELDGAELRNGQVDEGVFVAGTDDAAIESLGRASCGEDPFEDEIVSDVG